MATPPLKNRGKALLAFAAAAALVAFSSSQPFAIDVSLSGKAGGHALVRLGFASIKLVFDSGQKCPNPNACTGTLL